MLGSAAALGALDLAGAGDPGRAPHAPVRRRRWAGTDRTNRPDAPTRARPPSERPQAIALGSVNQNLARAIGPAIGGLLLAATSAALVFFVNAASFLAVIIVVATVAVPARVLTLPREHVREATRAGARFVRNAPVLIAIMIRAAAFGFFASGVWALLPLVARHTLGLGSGGYGLLLGAVGIGALLGATFSPAIRRALSPAALMAACAAAVALCALVLAVLARGRARRPPPRPVRGRLDPRARPAQRIVPVDAAQLGQGPGDGVLHGRFPGSYRDRRADSRRRRPGDLAGRRTRSCSPRASPSRPWRRFAFPCLDRARSTLRRRTQCRSPSCPRAPSAASS